MYFVSRRLCIIHCASEKKTTQITQQSIDFNVNFLFGFLMNINVILPPGLVKYFLDCIFDMLDNLIIP